MYIHILKLKSQINLQVTALQFRYMKNPISMVGVEPWLSVPKADVMTISPRPEQCYTYVGISH
jgi:hypothetical protein